ncbi:MAG: hypothetical protein ACE5KE_16230 [Methanosarcinales archaeon]
MLRREIIGKADKYEEVILSATNTKNIKKHIREIIEIIENCK